MKGKSKKNNIKKSRIKSSFYKLKITGVVLIVALIFGGIPLFNYYVVPKKVNTSLMVTSGMSLNQIRAEMGFDNRILNKIYDMLTFKSRVDMGYYEFNSSESFITVTSKLTNGNFGKIRITFPEGDSVFQIEQLLVSKGIITTSQFSQALLGIKDFPYPTPGGNFEGYFFPSTYAFYPSEPKKYVILTFLQEFEALYSPTKYSDTKAFYRRLIIASIVQKEVNQNTAMPMVAGVFYNRLAIGMRLQSDATVTYATGDQTLNLTKSDLSYNSPYNTYRVSGLPPTPICNPGSPAIDGAIHPLSSNYFFFLTTPNGEVIYATTYSQQLANEAEYLGK
ncbi:MAG: endolytic transglycosylase MltG [Fusobacteria bacterium]|nr:endolytic transglycosylase MltG [Fusobacteriota bacterium]